MVDTNKWGLFPWSIENGPEHIHPDYLEKANEIYPYCLVFKYLGKDDDYICLQYGDEKILAKPELFSEVASVQFDFGQKVKTYKGQIGIIKDIKWHYKDNCPMYFLIVDGKTKSKRFLNDELSPIDNA